MAIESGKDIDWRSCVHVFRWRRASRDDGGKLELRCAKCRHVFGFK